MDSKGYYLIFGAMEEADLDAFGKLHITLSKRSEGIEIVCNKLKTMIGKDVLILIKSKTKEQEK